jgi:hypothetical protein
MYFSIFVIYGYIVFSLVYIQQKESIQVYIQQKESIHTYLPC